MDTSASCFVFTSLFSISVASQKLDPDELSELAKARMPVEVVFVAIISALSLLILCALIASFTWYLACYRRLWWRRTKNSESDFDGTDKAKLLDKSIFSNSSDEDVIFFADNKYVDDLNASKPMVNCDFMLHDNIVTTTTHVVSVK